jgi:hypothetical protein
MAFRVNEAGALLAFCGAGCTQITVDGRTTVISDQPVGLVAWAPVEPSRRVAGGAIQQIWVYGNAPVHVPLVADAPAVEIVAEGATPGSRGQAVPFKLEEGQRLAIEKPVPGRWMYVVPVLSDQRPTTRP